MPLTGRVARHVGTASVVEFVVQMEKSAWHGHLCTNGGGFYFMTITKDLIEQFKQWVFSHSAADTSRSYAYYVSEFCLGKDLVLVNSPKFLMDLATRSRDKGLALNTIGNYTAGVKKFLRYMELFHSAVIFDLDKVKCKHPAIPEVDFLEKPEIQKIRDIIREDLSDLLDHALFEFYLNTGCRVSEGVALDWPDIDFEKGEVRVIGKGVKPRYVFLGESSYWLQKYLAERKNTDRPLFLSQYGTRLRRENVHVRIRKMGRKAKTNSYLGRSVHPHLLRATFCTYLIKSGVDPKIAQNLMGHKDLETTLRYYYAVIPEDMKEAHQSLQRYLKSPVG